jgi:two-component system OmpR family response regulator
MRILLIEDDPKTVEYIVGGLHQSGHACDALDNGNDGLKQAAAGKYDALVIDRMLPGLDGMQVLRRIRAGGDKTPALFLTAVGGIEDRVDGLEAGADDYLVKPFAMPELLARLNAITRRKRDAGEATVLRLADLEMNLVTRTVRRGNIKIELVAKEFRLLEYLLRNQGRLVTRMMLLEQVWNFHFDPKTSVVETHMSRLRAKIDKPFEVALIHTVRGAGYSMYAGN